MKKNALIFSLVLLMNCDSLAQKQASVPVRPLAEKGAKGDVLFGKENKKAHLTQNPQRLQIPDSSHKDEIHAQRRKGKHKKTTK